MKHHFSSRKKNRTPAGVKPVFGGQWCASVLVRSMTSLLMVVTLLLAASRARADDKPTKQAETKDSPIGAKTDGSSIPMTPTARSTPGEGLFGGSGMRRALPANRVHGASFAEVRPDANPSKEIFCLLLALGT